MSGERGTVPARLALAALCAVLFLTFLDNTIVSVALANMQSSLRSGVAGLQWIVDGYMLAFAGLMLTGGTLGDILGRKRMLLAGVAVFVAGSIVAALAPDASVLIAGRVVMGVGAAGSEPGTLSLIRQLYPEAGARARALGVWTAVSGISLATGPVLGGVLVQLAGWRGIFWLNVVLGTLAFAASARSLPESADAEGRSLDPPGLLLGAAAVVALTFAIIEGENRGFTSPWIAALFAAAAAAGAAFVAVERRRSDPVVPLELVAGRAFRSSTLVAFTTSFGLFAVFFFTALYLQVIAHYSGWRIALEFLPMAVAMVAAGRLAGALTAARGPRPAMVAGCACSGGGMFAVAAELGPHPGAALLGLCLALVGLGLGLALVAVTAGVLSAVPAARSGLAASTLNTSRQLGGVLAVAILGAVVDRRLVADLGRSLTSLGVPPLLHSLVIGAVTRGGLPASASAAEKANPIAAAYPTLVVKVLSAAESAFGSGVHATLVLAGVILFAGGLISLAASEPDTAQPS